MELIVTSDVFENNGIIPIKYTGHGEDISPPLHLSALHTDIKSLAIIMDDIKHPLFRVYNHWVIWNLPIMTDIPEGIPHGAVIKEFDNATQGLGYGRHKYRGPKPPLGTRHEYRYTVYVLDSLLELKENSKKADLLKIMESHVLQQGEIVGKYK